MLGDAEYPEVRPVDDPTLRWPGYVGASWKPGAGILFVGSVHSDFTKNGRRAGDEERAAIADRMALANRTWRDLEKPTSEDDQRYLHSTRAAYLRLAPGWVRAKLFGEVLAGALAEQDEPFDSAAWTNLAHCRARPRKTNEYRLQLACSGTDGAFPIGELIRLLAPAAVLISVGPVATTYAHRYDFWPTHQPSAGISAAPLVVAFNGGGRRSGYSGGRPPEYWLPRVVDGIRERQSRLAAL